MNKRQRKKLCCPKCGNRKRQWVDKCRDCYKKERNIMLDVFKELGNMNPILGAFMNGSGMFQYAGLL